jgi:Tol biopolymer transport system component
MKRTIIAAAVVAVTVFSIAALGQRAKEAETLYHRGVHYEEVRGELKEAIKIYEEIVAKYADDRPLAAKAYYHLGLCYEKLGRAQATDAFQKVVQGYPEQTEMVTLARERLSLLMRAASPAQKADQELKVRRVWQGPGMDSTGEISPDGKYLSCVDWSTSDLAVRDMETGQVRRLTSKEGSPPGSYEAPDHSIWAPNSREIAYIWYGSDPTFCELRLIGLDDTKPRSLYKGDYFKDWVYPCDWSPDGRYILAGFFRGTDYYRPSREIGLVSVKDGLVHYLETLRNMEIGLAKFSPDGRYILYDHPQKANSESHDISLLALEAKNTIPVIEHPADDRVLGWAPDGKSILFLSDRTGTRDAWMIQVADGKSQGPPRIIKRELGQVEAMGLTKGGSLYYSTSGFQWDIFSVSIDADSGRLLEGPQKMPLPYEGHNYQPRLSPDGNQLAYISQRGPGERNWVLGVFSLESGEAREIRPKGDFRRGFLIGNWMPDGRSILLYGDEMNRGTGFFKVDLQTGDTTLLLHDNDFLPKDEKGFPERSNFNNSHNGRSYFYLYQGPNNFCRVMMRSLDSKEEKEIRRLPIHDPSDNNTLRLSPDGLRFALLLREGENVRALKVFPVSGGGIREVHRFEREGRGFIDLAWSPDSRYIYFSKKIDPKEDWGPCELWRVPAEGGEAQNLRVTSVRILGLNVHPDGKRIIFHSRTADEQLGAVWVMENFLHHD